MGREEFEAAVGEVLAGLPHELALKIRNVAFGVEDGVERPNLLGLYQGIPLTRRNGNYAGALPDTITIYRFPILVRSDSRDEALSQIEKVVKHEVGHYFGLTDERLHELGYA